MTDRRTFLTGSAAAVSALALGRVLPVQAFENNFAGVVYTKDNPGKWRKKTGSHLPSVIIAGHMVKLVTAHPMSLKHYIVRHTLVLADGTVIGAKTFYPDDEKAVSKYELPSGYKGKIYATSFCNLHDFWVNETMV